MPLFEAWRKNGNSVPAFEPENSSHIADCLFKNGDTFDFLKVSYGITEETPADDKPL